MHKRRYTFKIWLTVIVILLITCFIINLISKQINKYSQASAGISQSKQIVIDPGHGGVDPGAIGVDNILEKDINLSIALNLRDLLIANGYEVIMTRDEDISIHNTKYKEIGKQKTSDLKNRLKIIHDHPNALVISIHQNKFEESKYNGAQMFYGKNNDLSKPLAKALQDAFKTQLQPNNKREIKQCTKDVYIIYNAKNPIVLAECGFVSNKEDAKNLTDKEYQKKVAFTIFIGISEFFKNI